ncbi:MAG: hypothetical protein K0B02_00625 [DPANN group archaeon]|nr:hypothetical protein [DPANN group archaeon]
MKVQVICSKCSSQTTWVWGNQVGRCENCDTLLNISEVCLSKEATAKILPAA